MKHSFISWTLPEPGQLCLLAEQIARQYAAVINHIAQITDSMPTHQSL